MTNYEELWKKANRAGRWLQIIPFVRFVAVTGSLGRNETKPDSDADLMVVTEPSRLYTARAFALTILQATGQRINVEGGRIGGTVDPNYWLTADHLDIQPHNTYVARDYTLSTPLWGSADIYTRIVQANDWVADYQRKFRDVMPPKQSSVYRLLQTVLELLCRLWPGLEAWCRSVQERKIRAFATRRGRPEKVVVTDRELRLHL